MNIQLKPRLAVGSISATDERAGVEGRERVIRVVMNQRDAAKALGISRTWLQVLEWRALAKIAAATGGDAPPLPRWQRGYSYTTMSDAQKTAKAARQRRWRAARKATA